jgi:hypothetical protein
MLRDSILDCNSRMERLGYNNASVIFLISRVGTSEEARQFVKGLGEDYRIGSTVYVSPSDLALKRAAFERSGDNNAYTLLVSIIPMYIVTQISYVRASANYIFSSFS